MRRILVNPHRTDFRQRIYSQGIESEIPYTVDFSVAATDRSTTVSSVAWSSEGSQTLTITEESLSSGVASAVISSTNAGEGKAKVTATYADGKTESQYIRIQVHNPEYSV